MIVFVPKGDETDNRFDKDTFKTRLKECMKECRFSQAALAKAVGVSRTTVCNWLSGDRPERSNLEKLAEVLGVLPEYLTDPNGYRDLGDQYDAEVLPRVRLDAATRSLIEQWLTEEGFTHELIFIEENGVPRLVTLEEYMNLSSEKKVIFAIFSQNEHSFQNGVMGGDFVYVNKRDIDLLVREILDYIGLRLTYITERNWFGNSYKLSEAESALEKK